MEFDKILVALDSEEFHQIVIKTKYDFKWIYIIYLICVQCNKKAKFNLVDTVYDEHLDNFIKSIHNLIQNVI